MGTFAVFGFLTAYLFAAIALAVHLRRDGRLRFGGVLLTSTAVLAMLLALVSNVYPVPATPYRYFPYVYIGYLALAMAICLRAKGHHRGKWMRDGGQTVRNDCFRG
jgi:amino acid transporter